MDKRKIRKNLSKARKAIKPMTMNMSHKDIKHVNNGMQYIQKALAQANPSAVNTFFTKKGLNVDPQTKKWAQKADGVVYEVTTQDMLSLINDAGNFIKHNY